MLPHFPREFSNNCVCVVLGSDITTLDGVYSGMISANHLIADGYYSVRVSYILDVDAQSLLYFQQRKLLCRKYFMASQVTVVFTYYL